MSSDQVLARFGTGVCRGEWGKNLGRGLYELRIRHTAEEIQSMFGDADGAAGTGARVLLRVYFTTHGRKVVLLLGGYDKGRRGGGRRQQKSIERARKMAKQVKRG